MLSIAKHLTLGFTSLHSAQNDIHDFLTFARSLVNVRCVVRGLMRLNLGIKKTHVSWEATKMLESSVRSV